VGGERSVGEREDAQAECGGRRERESRAAGEGREAATSETLTDGYIHGRKSGRALGLLGHCIYRSGLFRMPTAVNQFTVAGTLRSPPW
jgi:hypothetical protein